MKLSFLYLSLLHLSVSSEFLKVDPDHEQFFSGEDYSITLSCGSWSVKRSITGSTEVQSCGSKKDFGTVISGSVCYVTGFSSSDSGLYWCESATGDRSPQRPLSVTDRNLILDSPGLPVAAGSDITLSCRNRTGSGLNPVLVKDGTVVHNGPQWSFTVSKEQEGEYICRDEKKREESEKKRLTVTELTTAAPPPSPPNSSSPTSSSPSSSAPSPTGAPNFLWILGPVLGGLVLLALVLGLVLYRRRSQTGSDPESAEVTYADVNVIRAAAAPPAVRGEEDTVYSGVRTHPKGPVEVTYGEVTIKPKKKKNRRREESNGQWSDPDVVYSSVRTRGSAPSN